MPFRANYAGGFRVPLRPSAKFFSPFFRAEISRTNTRDPLSVPKDIRNGRDLDFNWCPIKAKTCVFPTGYRFLVIIQLLDHFSKNCPIFRYEPVCDMCIKKVSGRLSSKKAQCSRIKVGESGICLDKDRIRCTLNKKTEFSLALQQIVLCLQLRRYVFDNTNSPEIPSATIP